MRMSERSDRPTAMPRRPSEKIAPDRPNKPGRLHKPDLIERKNFHQKRLHPPQPQLRFQIKLKKRPMLKHKVSYTPSPKLYLLLTLGSPLSI